ncbi:conserved hypothetical protein [Flavobacterium sp. 9AF]|uniref:YcxB family protein n=1 Tax=Flavobacterium sp. 9AF TaxID=2653142 RepID=UPI0012F12C33|nr:YcxB family protein [Flavobacterium sp. 9AF]VXB06548.1 conserved hypothetical protein [Flavobacterium sp. 9AF]
MEKEIIIKPSFDVKSTFKASMNVFFGSKLIVFLAIFIAINIFSIHGTLSMGVKDIFSAIAPIFIIPLLIIIYLFVAYRNSKKQIQDNPRIKENIIYTLNSEYFEEKGDSFEVKHFWKNIKKVVEKNDLFLIYIGNNRANFIRKVDLKENQYNELKELLNSLNIKKSLKL